MTENKRLLWVAVFAAAMAWVESAVVVYLRTMIGRLQPYQPNPLPGFANLSEIEVVREAATIIMLFAAGWLAGRTWRSRLAYAVLAFGVWDILYYVYLKVLTGWPMSLLDWDILFLLPLPWWGPVIAPVSIALLLVVLGGLISHYDEPGRPFWPSGRAWAMSLAGALLALYVFMADAIAAVPQGSEAVRRVLPQSFNWPLFLPALILLAAPVFDLTRRLWLARPALTSASPSTVIFESKD